MDLSRLASAHTNETKKYTNDGHAPSPSLSLTDLARNHLQGSSSIPGTSNAFEIPSLFPGTTPSTCIVESTQKQAFAIPSLFGDIKTLNTQPLTGTLRGTSGADTFQIPDLFGSGVQTILKNNDDGSGVSDDQINLMSALTVSNDSNPTSCGTEPSKIAIRRNEFQDVCQDVLSQTQDLSKCLSNLSLDNHSQSSMATVICTQWISAPSDKKVVIDSPLSCSSKIKPFRFDTPSPDDIVKKAQSRVFRTQVQV